MRKFLTAFLMLMFIFSTTTADARGGRSSDDCPASSKDPDCK
ncbi:hypothetical protein GGD83_003412 [Rhodoblastus sphagnicola]|nr:hypothetical protein [Rhodoblastus sphagnicola]